MCTCDHRCEEDLSFGPKQHLLMTKQLKVLFTLKFLITDLSSVT